MIAMPMRYRLGNAVTGGPATVGVVIDETALSVDDLGDQSLLERMRHVITCCLTTVETVLHSVSLAYLQRTKISSSQ